MTVGQEQHRAEDIKRDASGGSKRGLKWVRYLPPILSLGLNCKMKGGAVVKTPGHGGFGSQLCHRLPVSWSRSVGCRCTRDLGHRVMLILALWLCDARGLRLTAAQHQPRG